jgi:hypothetical protein
MKPRTLVGPMKGKMFYIGYTDHEVYVTLWASSDVVSISRASLPHPLIKQWGQLYRIGGIYWREVPHNFIKDPKQLILFKDTWRTNLTLPFRHWLLIPGSRPWERLSRARKQKEE